MTVVARFARALEKRSAPAIAYPRYSTGVGWPRMRTATGAAVTVDTALELIPVYSAVSLIAGAIGSLPLKVYTNPNDGTRVEAKSSRQWRLLHDRPNDEMAADEFWEIVATSLLLWGNAFLYKERTDGVVQGLWPIRPSRVQVGRDDTNSRYFSVDGSRDRVYETDILHIRGLGTDGLVGLSPVQQARQQLANDQAHAEFQGTLLKNGLFSTAVFTHPNRLSEDAALRLETKLAERSGWLEAGGTIMLEEGSDLKNLTMSLEDAQFVELAQWGDHRVAQLFGLIPPHQWGATATKSLDYTNSEFGGLEFVKWALRRWLVRIESSLKRDPGLFPAPGPNLMAEFLTDALLRADAKSRWENYKIMLDTGVVTKEWVAETENLPEPPPEEPPPAAALVPAGTPPPPPGQNDSGAARALPMPAETLPVAYSGSLAVLEELRGIFRPEIRVEVPPTVVHVESQRQLPPDVIVAAPDMEPIAAALDRLTEAVTGKELAVTVEPAAVTVNQPSLPVQLTLEMPAEPPEGEKTVTFQRDGNGRIKSATVTDG